MSGSGGSGGAEFRPVPTGGNGEDGDEDGCAITERANLNSPDATVVSTLQVGDPLLVELIDGNVPRVIIKTATNQIAGSLTSRRLVTFIECIRSGYGYQATVLAISGGLVEIEISPA